MDITFKDAKEIIEKSIGRKVRYRVDGIAEYTNDIIKSITQDNELNIDFRMQNESIMTREVNQISITEYDERTDIWFYGINEKANRFNVYK